MKTTIEINDELLTRAKKHARQSRTSLRAIVEEGLHLALNRSREPARYQLKDFSVGDPAAEDPLERLSWQDLRAEIFGEPHTGR